MVSNIDCVSNFQRTINRRVKLTQPTMANRWPQTGQRTTGTRGRISGVARTQRKTLPLQWCNRRQQIQLHKEFWKRPKSKKWVPPMKFNRFAFKKLIVDFAFFFLFLLGAAVLCVLSQQRWAGICVQIASDSRCLQPNYVLAFAGICVSDMRPNRRQRTHHQVLSQETHIDEGQNRSTPP